VDGFPYITKVIICKSWRCTQEEDSFEDFISIGIIFGVAKMAISWME